MDLFVEVANAFFRESVYEREGNTLIDDNRGICESLRILLELEGFIVDCCENGHNMVVTGCGSIETYLDAVRLGAFEYISKPYRMKELKWIIDGFISGKFKGVRTPL
jgi:DNA-binding NtrC family response regulator